MLKNFIILAIRNLVKSRTTSIINILGFSLGITCCLIIYFKVKYELSFDRFHTQSENTFRVVRHTKGLGLKLAAGEWEYRDGVFGALPGEIKRGIPEAVYVSPVMNFGYITISVPDSKTANGVKLFKVEGNAGLVEPTFFNIFDYRGTNFGWIEGSPSASLSEPFSIVLTQTEANKYFPGENPMSKTILLDKLEFRVTGIVTDFPTNTDLPFKLLMSYSTIDKIDKGFTEDWNGLGNNQCYIALQNPDQKEIVESKIRKIYSQHASKEESENRIFKLQPLKDLHSDSRFGNYSNRLVSKEIVFALICVGLFIVIIASINYANLALARSGLRTREVGIRKVFGSSRRLIVAQFLGESFIITLVAMNIGLLCCKLILALSPAFLSIPAGYTITFDGFTIVFFILLLLLISFISGSYPALVVSRFQPVDILKSKFVISRSGKLIFTRAMVVLQFTISLIMIIATVVVLKQLKFLNDIDLGYNKEAVFVVGIPKNDKMLMERFKTTLLKNPYVQHVSLNTSDPAKSASWTDITRFENGEEKRIVTQIVSIDTSYIGTFRLNLLAGRNISNIDSGKTLLVNEQAIKDLEFKSIHDAVGAEVNLYANPNNKVTIVGVLKDYYYESLRNKVRPTALVGNNRVDQAGIKLALDQHDKRNAYAQMKSVLQYTQHTWESIYPDNFYEYTFLEDRLNSYYRNEQLTSQLFNIFAIITIFIGCLGIFGLAFYTSEQKSKEIAVRKVNGASVGNIIGILSKNYAIWLGIAFLIACPVAFFAMRKWLESFAYKTEISWWVFALAGLTALTVAAITVSWQSYKAAVRNPVDSLKYE